MSAPGASTGPSSIRSPAGRWDGGLGRRFLVSVDVEEEFDWSGPLPRGPARVTAVAALPAFHRRMAAAGIVPAYMVDHAVVTDPHGAATMAEVLGDDPVGAQLHPWINPPFDEAIEVAGDGRASFPGNLPPTLEAAKLDRLATAIEAALGRPPVAYRAGRYGIGPRTGELLSARGIRIDMSMRSRFDYRRQGGPDFRAVGPGAFLLRPDVLEVPLTTIFVGRMRRFGPRLHPRMARLPIAYAAMARLGWLSRVPLTPEGTSAREAVAAVRQAAEDGERLLQLAFHSPSLVPGHTPYVRDAADRQRFDGWWGSVLEVLALTGYRPVSLAQLVAAMA